MADTPEMVTVKHPDERVPKLVTRKAAEVVYRPAGYEIVRESAPVESKAEGDGDGEQRGGRRAARGE